MCARGQRRQGLKIECVWVCVLERDTETATETKAETVVGGRLMEE